MPTADIHSASASACKTETTAPCAADGSHPEFHEQPASRPAARLKDMGPALRACKICALAVV
eukprot:5268764-Pyramimonas_sp.AAC.1